MVIIIGYSVSKLRSTLKAVPRVLEEWGGNLPKARKKILKMNEETIKIMYW